MTSRRLLLVAALVDLIAPLAAAAVVLFGGATIGNCHATVGDGTPRPACPVEVVVQPLIRTNEGIAISLAVCALAWLVANYVLLSHLAQVDRPRLLRLAVGIGIAGLAMANVGFAHGLRFRLLYAAEGAVTWGIAGLALAWVIGLAWAGLRPTTFDASAVRESRRTQSSSLP